MNVGTASRLIALTKGIYPSSKANDQDTLTIWMGLFGNKDDGLMETALRLCWSTCKFFPTPAEITTAIKELVFEETTKPKQIGYEVKRDSNLAKKALDFVRDGKAKEYMQSLNIDKLVEYARDKFPDISPELVLRNYPEFMQGMEQQEKCFACRMQKQACQGWMVKPYLDFKTGWVSNQMGKCEKND